MESRTVTVREIKGRGTRGGSYIYVVEGRELVHIGDYAVRELPGEYKDEVVYEIPVDKVAGKVLHCFDFSGSGVGFLCKCRIEDFERGVPKKWEYYEPIRKRIHEIRGLRFRVKDPTLLSLLTQFERVFVPMIREVKEYGRARDVEIRLGGARLWDAFEDPEVYYFTFMSLPDDRRRITGLKNTRKRIYQLWVLKLLCDAFKVSKFKEHLFEGRAYWWIEQGSGFSTCIAETPFGDLTFWLEFQPSRTAHVMSMFSGKRVPIRPDIVVVKGHFEGTSNFIRSGKPIDLIVECKEDPFDKWEKEIRSQILPYLEKFKPNNFIIASLERVPDIVKRDLERRGIKVIDDLKPGSKSIGALFSTIESLRL